MLDLDKVARDHAVALKIETDQVFARSEVLKDCL